MSVIVSRQIREREFGGKLSAEDRVVLIRAARVALATPLSSKGLPAATRLLKAYATSSRGPRRIVYLLSVGDGTLFLLFYRAKTDTVGINITPNNAAFAQQLKKHLAFLHADIEAGDYEEIIANVAGPEKLNG